jgi:sec-independent protein translocase protein TatB
LGLSPIRLLIVAVVALIVLGPDKLPQVARQAGSLWHSLRTLQQRVETELREVAPDLPRSSDLVRFARSPVALLNELADKASASEDGAAADGVAAMADDGGYEPPDDGPLPVSDPERPPLAWGDPSLN